LLAENRPACSFRWKVHKGRFQNFCRPGIGVPKKEIEDVILKDIQERPRPSGNLLRHQRGAGRGLSLLGAPSSSPAWRSSPRRWALFADAGRLTILRVSRRARISSVLNESVFRALSHARKHPVHVGREHAL